MGRHTILLGDDGVLLVELPRAWVAGGAVPHV